MVPEWILQTAFGGGMAAVGWLVGRWITNAKGKENTDRLLSATNLIESLRNAGVSLQQARTFDRELSASKGRVSEETLEALIYSSNEDSNDEPIELTNTMALKIRLSARQDTVEAQLEERLVELHLLIPEEMSAALENNQKAWEKFRDAESELGASYMAGGSGEAVSAMSASIAASEVRLEQLGEMITEAKGMFV